MCEWNKQTYLCGHYYLQASWWCRTYTRTHRRCPINITSWENKDTNCSRCSPRIKEVDWENLISRKEPAPHGTVLRNEPPVFLLSPILTAKSPE
ncbi:hypothetical protein F5883DRAFT_593665 [Diaporthe sp. PMI_573]|nr:hypothetical protein F5883DRAFT_593665 [Diaporthaceae sp. PMI_573]